MEFIIYISSLGGTVACLQDVLDNQDWCCQMGRFPLHRTLFVLLLSWNIHLPLIHNSFLGWMVDVEQTRGLSSYTHSHGVRFVLLTLWVSSPPVSHFIWCYYHREYRASSAPPFSSIPAKLRVVPLLRLTPLSYKSLICTTPSHLAFIPAASEISLRGMSSSWVTL